MSEPTAVNCRGVVVLPTRWLLPPSAGRLPTLGVLRLSIACLLVVSACSKPQPGSEPEPQTTSQAVVTAAVSAPSSSTAPKTKLPGFLPPKTPELAPQLVACGKREFYRVGEKSLDAFEVAEVIPPPAIRGSRVARQVAKIPVAEPSNVVALSGTGAFFVSKDVLVRYTKGQSDVRRFQALPSSEPLSVWFDGPTDKAIWTRVHGNSEIRKYPLTALPNTVTVSEAAVDASGRQVLPAFDSRVFTALPGGKLLYSTSQGLVTKGAGAKPLLPNLPVDATRVVADAVKGRFWVVRPGKVELWTEAATAPNSTFEIKGAVIDIDVSNDVVAVLSMDRKREAFQPSVSIFRAGALVKQVIVGASIGVVGQPQLDVCLFPDRPWIVVGGKKWMQLLDWTAPRLLAEW